MKIFALLSTILLASLFPVPISAADITADRAARFQAALTQAREAQTREALEGAIQNFQSLIDEGIVNGHLYYNLGNAYYRLDDLGYAILNWRRAQSLCPGDADIERNLAFGRSERREQFKPPDSQQVLNLLFFWHQWPATTRYWLALSALALFWCLLLTRLFVRKALLTLSSILCLALALALAVSTFLSFHDRNQHPPAVLVAPQTHVYRGNSTTYEEVFTEPVHAGAEVKIIENRDGWLRIAFPNGENGWVREMDPLGQPVIVEI